MFKLLNENTAHNSIVFAIIYTLYKFLAWEDTRKRILSMDKLLSLILKLTKSTNSRVVFMVINFLDVVQLFEPSHSEKVKKKKFKIYNKEFLKSKEKTEEDYGQEY